ncbi:MAG: hypothetical protein C0484_18680 [Rhodospirillum sp.]|nr:hypothetical protein [Rhodospirillum sp.]
MARVQVTLRRLSVSRPSPSSALAAAAFYVNSIRAVDEKLTQLLDELDALGIAERTIVVYTADHGEMAGAHGLRNKGPFAYEDNIHVPFYVVHPDVRGGQTSLALTSHVDVAPTLLAMAGVSAGKIEEHAGRELPGKDISQVLSDAGAADVHALREGILFTYSGLLLNDAKMLEGVPNLIAAGENPKDPATLAKHGLKPDLKKRGTIRTVHDGRYKLSRYFSPAERNRPTTLNELYANNDAELFDLQADPSEMTNLAATKEAHGDLTLAMSAKLEAVIKAEIGTDDGREMPDFEGIKWALGTLD